MSVKQTIDGSATGVTKWIDVRSAVNASITIAASAGLTGALTLEASDDAETFIDENFKGTAAGSSALPAVDISAASAVVTVTGSLSLSGSAGNVLLSIHTPPGFVRVKYTRTSGSGTINVFVTGPGVRC